MTDYIRGEIPKGAPVTLRVANLNSDGKDCEVCHKSLEPSAIELKPLVRAWIDLAGRTETVYTHKGECEAEYERTHNTV